MPIRTETFDLAEVYADMSERIDTLTADLEDMAEETPHYEATAAERSELVMRRQGLARFADVYPDADTVTIGELNPAEYAAIEKHLPENHGQQAYRTVMTGVATAAGPYVVEGDVEATITTVRDDVPAYFTRWAAAKADELLHTEVDENPFSRTPETEASG